MANTEKDRDAWLAQVSEDALEPELPIVDPHHHLWDHPGSRYMLDEILRDTNSGHRVLATVFVECMSMYRADGPEPMRPVGETEFVNGIAAQSASGQYGETRVAAGIVGFADLTLGDAVVPVLEAHIAAAPARFRGIRHAGGFDASPDVRNSHTNPPPDLYESKRFREGFGKLKAIESQLRGVAVPSADAGGDRAREGVPGHDDRAQSLRRTARESVPTKAAARKYSANGRRTSRSSRDARTSWPSSAESTCR